MDNKDDEKRRVMTPPEEWTGGVIKRATTETSAVDHALENITDDTEWLEDGFSSGSADDEALSPAPPLADEALTGTTFAENANTESTPEDVTNEDDSWLDLESGLEAATEVVAPTAVDDDWQADPMPAPQSENPPADAQAPIGATSEPHDDDPDWVDANSIINIEQPSTQQIADTETSAELGSPLTGHVAAPARKFPLWPALLLGAALVLLGVGGWGAITERSTLKARILELEKMNNRTTASGNLDAKAENALAQENEALRGQLATLGEQYATLSEELNSTQDTQAENSSAAAKQVETDAAPAEDIDPISEPAVDIGNESAAASSSIAENTVVAASMPVASGGPWFVNIGSYVDRDVAAESVKQFEPMDDLLVIEAANVNGRTYYRIRATGFATQAEAQSAAKQFETTFNMQPLWVGKANDNGTPISATTSVSASASIATTNLDPTTNPDSGGWFIYVDTFKSGDAADKRAQLIKDTGLEAKVAVELRQEALLYRVQVVGISTAAQGEEMLAKLNTLEVMPNLELRRF